MARITYLDPVKDVSGKVCKADRTCYNHRRASGRNYTSVPQARDYELHPLTARELAARAAFKQAATAVKAIMNNDEQKVQALQRFNEAKAKRLTTATTLHGFLMQEAI